MNHNTLVIPNGIDIVIHSGDSTNFKNPILNKIEFDAFSDWFIKLNIKNKILIAGNHIYLVILNFFIPLCYKIIT